MSPKNPWLVVVAGLASLGLLAKTMAQSNDQTAPYDDGVSLRYEDPLEVTIGEIESASDEVELDTQWGPVREQSGPRGRLLGQLGNQETERDQRRQTRTAQVPRQPNLTPRHDEVDPRENGFYGPSGNFADADDGQTDRDSDHDSRAFETQRTAILGPARAARSGDRALPNDSLRYAQEDTELGLNDASGLSQAGRPNRTQQDMSLARSQKTAGHGMDDPSTSNADGDSLPRQDGSTIAGRSWMMWITMGLFASLAGNLFFCWVAWDTHLRYRDLVDDMSESDHRLQREKRRLRDDGHVPAARGKGRDDFAFHQNDRD